MSAVQIELSTVAYLKEYGADLFQEHADEAEPHFADHVDPNWEFYESQGDSIVVLVAKDPEDGLIGYLVAAFVPSPHYAHLAFVQVDLIFVRAEHRRRGVGVRLLRRAKELAKAVGPRVSHMLLHAKRGSTFEAYLDGTDAVADETVYRVKLWE